MPSSEVERLLKKGKHKRNSLIYFPLNTQPNIMTCFKGALSRQFCYIYVKMAQIFDKEPFFQHEIAVRAPGRKYQGEEQTISSFWRLFYDTQEELEKIGQIFQVVIHFHASHPQPKIINTSLCALLGLLLTKPNHYFDHSIDSNMFFGYSK